MTSLFLSKLCTGHQGDPSGSLLYFVGIKKDFLSMHCVLQHSIWSQKEQPINLNDHPVGDCGCNEKRLCSGFSLWTMEEITRERPSLPPPQPQSDGAWQCSASFHSKGQRSVGLRSCLSFFLSFSPLDWCTAPSLQFCQISITCLHKKPRWYVTHESIVHCCSDIWSWAMGSN